MRLQGRLFKHLLSTVPYALELKSHILLALLGSALQSLDLE